MAAELLDELDVGHPGIKGTGNGRIRESRDPEDIVLELFAAGCAQRTGCA